ncbi:hypothetical protein B0I35DRAFT_437407 [Stachybotrys elegans]|uniref:Uncharacterized protein n=1 Tax=Stachybotrys elegans TaxID=80388 RepID=A0A8K0WPW5_9HYPO|nr:hypothetical protein B0I35DRAFT_437407 [Stachybotrys elegans]
MFTSEFPHLYQSTKGQMPTSAPANQCPVWGFLVYRTTYADQALWEKYIDYVTKSVLHEIDCDAGVPEVMRAHNCDWRANNPVPSLLELGRVIRRYFHLCLKEGPEYDGKSVEEIRDIHVRWLDSLPEEGVWHNADGSHNCADVAGHHKRYFGLWPRYCHAMYVDLQALERFAEAWKEDGHREPDDLLRGAASLCLG